MKNLALLLTLALPLACFAKPPKISETIAYSGKLGEQDVFMTLSIADDKVIGSYFYKKYGVPIHLAGSVSGSNLLLVEKNKSGDAHINAKLKENGIEGVWVRNGNGYNVNYSALSIPYSAIIKEINIIRSEGEDIVIYIEFINGGTQRLNFSIMEEDILVVFEDFTFDGYPDMRVLELEAGGNSSFIYFDYDVENERFKRSSNQIRQLINPKVVHEEKSIISVSKDGCCIYHAKKILPTEIRYASYDFSSGVGSEVIKNKVTKKKSKRSISEFNFERNYLGLTAEPEE